MNAVSVADYQATLQYVRTRGNRVRANRVRAALSPVARIRGCKDAGILPPDSSEKPYSRNRETIDGSGNLNLPEEKRLEYLRQAFFALGNDPHVRLDGWHHEAHRAQAHARQVTPIDLYFSAGKTVPLLDLQGEHDAVVIMDMFKSALGSRVEVRVIQGVGHAMAPERPKAMADEIAKFMGRFER